MNEADRTPDPSTSFGESAPQTSPADAAAPDEKTADRLKKTRLPPELREWARQQFPEEALLRGLQEVQATGGLSSAAFLEGLVEPVSEDREHA